jgi:hypothetical protein
MSGKAESRLTPRERLARGLTYTAVGPVDVTRGVVGLGVHSVSRLRHRYRKGQLARDIAAAQETIAQELGAAQDVVTNLPQARRSRRSRRRGKRPLLIAGVVVGVLAVGGAAFSIVRRSMRPSAEDSSPRPPSVDIQPRP